MSENVRGSVWLMAAGTMLGLALGYMFEKSSCMGLITGYPSLMMEPGKHVRYVYSGPLSGVVVIISGLVGALIGSVAGTIGRRE